MTAGPGAPRSEGQFSRTHACPDCRGTLRAAILDGAAVLVCLRCPAHEWGGAQRSHLRAWRFELGRLRRADAPPTRTTCLVARDSDASA